MLSHYSPLKVAENFQVLQALHPNRIDMGLGRAPGSDARTAHALQSFGNASGSDRYLESVLEIRTLLRREIIETGPLAGVQALPLTETMPELWLLASSEGSASVAAHCGLPLSWAHLSTVMVLRLATFIESIFVLHLSTAIQLFQSV
ncbi:MAG: hypothetical protein Ct9H90mP11_07260 [Acidimicrobiales bacterium]|nr:MAG: hypothetical protein Ct9H90mP11_07260 [Acidimicrobiales bacterium]